MISGPEIKAKRKALGLTVIQLAENLGVSKDNLYKWEKGHLPSNPEDYNKLEKWLNGIELFPREMKESNGKEIGKVPDVSTLELLLHEKEARGKETEEALKREIEALRLERERTDFLLNVMKDNLNVVTTNSTQSLVYLETILRHDRSAHQVGLANQDVQLHQPVGTSTTKADNLELAAKARHRKKDKNSQDGAGRLHKKA
jgi:transcriptional regulator with XRE-family HTH domain